MPSFIADELFKLKQLLDCGALTQDEFNTQKEKLLSGSEQLNTENTQAACFEYSGNPETRYKITINSIPIDSRANVIKAVCMSLALSSEDGERFINSLPRVLRFNMTEAECRRTAERYISFGCDIKIEIDDHAVSKVVRTIDEIPGTTSSAKANQPTCPYCHSTNVEKITMGKKAVKGWLWGVAAASTLTKEWHCKNCKSNF